MYTGPRVITQVNQRKTTNDIINIPEPAHIMHSKIKVSSHSRNFKEAGQSRSSEMSPHTHTMR